MELQDLPKATSNTEKYLSYLSGNEIDLPKPISNIDKYLYYLCINGGGTLDDKQNFETFETLEEMKNFNTAELGKTAICTNNEDGNLYVFNVNNYENETTGKWRKPVGRETGEYIKKTDGVNSLSINSTEQQYANAKATYLHIEERINSIQSAKKVWNKPLLNLDTTELNTIYYYQTGDNAWINKLWIPPTQDYGSGVYAYFDGIKWLTFNVADVSVPALSQKDVYKFYVLYNEKYSRCQARAVEIATGTDEAIGGWSNIITRDEKPEGAIEVVEERYDRLGVWYKTVYLGDDKTNCFDITVPVSQDETGHLTTDDISTIIDENSTNLTIPTSRAVYEKFKNITIPSTEPVDKTTGSIWLV